VVATHVFVWCVCLSAMEFSHDGKYLAVAERRDYKDCIGIYHCDTWELIKVSAVASVVCWLYWCGVV